ncbi:SBDS family rRNA metabolism protein [Cryptococcus neoformans C23]|uniref:SBDS family rRNA metabolism protein n=1 Tax=Cryptococcus neoformans Tu259-1 TaxID=1230072 RepID=A0A854QHS0_CRYNE|nr:SBDS family rRNA metabolism protein [Cryptococcus neoformans var. grubii AD2-60a]OWZ45737.1 SBDS family rRNA metabolism protein [Cryptococcus neoformans var. grubii C23]OWZ48509.1 SBDS family rRNA metabolism protein [Cryptococcus neoformans var. grubii AD1-83a]OWZ52917.1 SBDS family rRNA metabolism protein [Cryptococcus neoformans var. grubii c45]OXB37902.1 SBDS family rRNA metabolism protein [Cryptococcus neoformans var. grubii]OXC62556.1 SBDS family rRNA metabolism protein [Cryptococcus n
MLRQPGTQIKCVGYRTLEPVISTRSLMCLCRLTNVSIVRMKKGGKRFEIACYQNKVSEFRSGVENDLSEVLQIEQVFTNVPKGLVAKKEDWSKCFGTDDMAKVIEEILKKGELQINNLERTQHLSSLSREIATIVSEMTVDPSTSRKHTVGMVEKAMAEVGFSVRADRPAKAQALELIKKLGEGDVLPVRRVRMRVRITMPGKDAKRCKDKIVAECDEVEEEDMGMEWEAIVQINPSTFRTLTDLVNNETKGKGRVESMGSVGN